MVRAASIAAYSHLFFLIRILSVYDAEFARADLKSIRDSLSCQNGQDRFYVVVLVSCAFELRRSLTAVTARHGICKRSILYVAKTK